MQTRSDPSRARGFTMVELMVAIVIVVVLAAIAMIGYGRIRLSGNKAASINNIRNLSAAALAVAADHNGRFVDIHSNQAVPYRFSRTFRDDYNISRDNAYSNANDCWKTDGYDHCQDRDLWDFSGGDTVFGYACMINDQVGANTSGWATGDFEEPDNWERIKDKVSFKEGRTTKVRWVPRRLGVEVAYPLLFMDLCRIYNGQIVGNFMKNDEEPLGVHVGYLDGHIEWVDGDKMKVRYRGGADVLW